MLISYKIYAAANELHISQPSLSQLLKRLEQEMGTPLFNRVGKHIELNTYGIIFLKYVNEMFASLDNAELEIQTVRGLSDKTVTLSVQSASMLLPDIYCVLKNTDPTLLLYILQNGQEHLPRRDELIISSDRNANAFLAPAIRLCRDVIINFFTKYSLPDQ